MNYSLEIDKNYSKESGREKIHTKVLTKQVWKHNLLRC